MLRRRVSAGGTCSVCCMDSGKHTCQASLCLRCLPGGAGESGGLLAPRGWDLLIKICKETEFKDTPSIKTLRV